VGSGGFWGKGLLQGTQIKFAFLPAKSTDFIFAVLGEQFGFVGSIAVLSLFFIFLYRVLRIADEARNDYTRLVAIGLGAIIFFGALVNIGMVTGLMPVTGLPLPFISLGGTSLITTFGIVGILLNIYSHGVEGP
jgi:rod shape determining protein RodA